VWRRDASSCTMRRWCRKPECRDIERPRQAAVSVDRSMNNRFMNRGGETLWSCVLATAALLSTGRAFAQPDNPETLPRVETEEDATPDDQDIDAVADTETTAADIAQADSTPTLDVKQVAPTREQYEALEARLAALEATQAESELAALTNEEAEAE